MFIMQYNEKSLSLQLSCSIKAVQLNKWKTVIDSLWCSYLIISFSESRNNLLLIIFCLDRIKTTLAIHQNILKQVQI